MTEQNSKPRDRRRILINSFVGKVDPKSMRLHHGHDGHPYVSAVMTVPGRDLPVHLYLRGAAVHRVRERAHEGRDVFVEGDIMMAGKCLSVWRIEPKRYTGTIEVIHKVGCNRRGDWAAVRMMVGGVSMQVMLSGADARAAAAAGKGGSITFKGAWKPQRNEITRTWHSRLVSASSLFQPPDPEAPPSA